MKKPGFSAETRFLGGFLRRHRRAVIAAVIAVLACFVIAEPFWRIFLEPLARDILKPIGNVDAGRERFLRSLARAVEHWL